MSERQIAVLLIAHGSHRAEANADLEVVAAQLRARGRYPIVELAYLEIAGPGIDAGAELCVKRGATSVILLPYFLSPGRHVVLDLAAARDRLVARFTSVRFALADPLGPHPAILDVLEERARQVEND